MSRPNLFDQSAIEAVVRDADDAAVLELHLLGGTTVSGTVETVSARNDSKKFVVTGASQVTHVPAGHVLAVSLPK